MKNSLKMMCFLCYLNFLYSNSLFAEVYKYPFKDPLMATIAGTPDAFSYSLPDVFIEEYKIKPLVERCIPDIMWHDSLIKYSVVPQEKEAPLVFVIAGTGGTYRSSTVKYFLRLFHSMGFTAVGINSPISQNFIVTSSRSAYPGVTSEDARDIYDVMKLVYEDIKSRGTSASEFYLSGYSLGGLEAAFVAKLDEGEKFFKFKKVLMINPPVNLYSSITKIDAFLPLAENDSKKVVSIVMERLTKYFIKRGEVGFGKDFLYEVNKIQPLQPHEVEQLIGATFRLFLANTVFSCDLLNNKKLIVDKPLTPSDPLLPYFKESLLWSFTEYIDYYLLPYWKEKHPGKGKDGLIKDVGLIKIQDYLKKSRKICVMHNEDDIILDKDDIIFLKETFGDRLKLYPYGGHLGNVRFVDNAKFMIEFFKSDLGE
jgi:hypothetical protein